MTKYIATATETATYSIEIEADSLQEATQIAEITMSDLWTNINYDFNVDEVYKSDESN